MKRIFILLSFLASAALAKTKATPTPKAARSTVPSGFLSFASLAPKAKITMAYNTRSNFIGDRIDGYKANICYLTRPAALALAKVQESLEREGYSLRIFDCYRPQKAVDHFIRWAQNDPSDMRMKAEYYPSFSQKIELFNQGYISRSSKHSAGSTVDLGLVKVDGEGRFEDVDMHGHFDLLDPISNTNNPNVRPAARTHRNLLKRHMEAQGFSNYSKEWWHYTLNNEPYPNERFNFDVDVAR